MESDQWESGRTRLSSGGASVTASPERNFSKGSISKRRLSEEEGRRPSQGSGGYSASLNNNTEIELSKRLSCCTMFECCQMILRNSFFSFLMTALTMFVLVGDDIRLVAFAAGTDWVFNLVSVICLVLFSTEIFLSSVVNQDYFLGFWFLCDLLSSVSLIFDLTYVSEVMMDSQPISLQSQQAGGREGSVSESEYARASRAGRVGTRVARLLRIVRLVRLSRVMRCLLWFLLSTDSSQGAGKRMGPGASAEITETQEESRVGRKLSERTTQRVIILVLIMLFAVPQLKVEETHTMMQTSAQYGANVIFQAWEDYERAMGTNGTARTIRQRRQSWEDNLLTYIYYHNWHATCPQDDGDTACASDWNYRLCWVGYITNGQRVPAPDPLNVFDEAYVQVYNDTAQWEPEFSGMGETTRTLQYWVGSLPGVVMDALRRPWTTSCPELHWGTSTVIQGASLIPGLPCPRNTLRMQETTWFIPNSGKLEFLNAHMEGQFVFVFDMRKFVQWEAIFGILQTVFVVLVLAIGALMFSRDADLLVLLPIERMIMKVEMIRRDPLYAMRLGDKQQETHEQEMEMQQAVTRETSLIRRAHTKGYLPDGSSRNRLLDGRKRKPKKKTTTLETMILENAIIKLGSLLALGFGEAGSEIIGQNLDDEQSTVNALVPGSKVEAIYGFCNIRNFTTTTEVLQEKTMVFVNQVAAIVHRIVDGHLGAANKNVGEAFLLVWHISKYDREMHPKIADLAVISFVQVVAELNCDRQLAKYREHPALLARFPGFRVSLGFGLHMGWSIEGAIGSNFKIDASYLSPHVNVASILEAATSEYKVTILMSEPLVRMCNQQFSRHFRVVDHVKIHGAPTSTRLFTVDLNFEGLAVESARTEKLRKNKTRSQERQEREENKANVLKDDFQVHAVFAKDRFVRRMRDRFFLGFFQEFEKGYLNYEAGEWDVAAQVLTRTRYLLWNSGLNMSHEDGPSCTLLEYMRSFNYEAPGAWPGWRELRERN